MHAALLPSLKRNAPAGAMQWPGARMHLQIYSQFGKATLSNSWASPFDSFYEVIVVGGEG